MTFGEKLASIRKQANMTQNDLAEKLDISRQAITKWERGKGFPDIDNLQKLSAIFSVSIDELINYKVETIKYEADSMTETIYSENSKFKNVDKFVLERFIDYESIKRLTREVKLTFWQEVFDFFIGAGTLEVGDLLKTGLVHSYLVSKDNNDYLVLISKNKLFYKKLSKRFEEKSRVIDGYKYSKIRNGKIK